MKRQEIKTRNQLFINKISKSRIGLNADAEDANML